MSLDSVFVFAFLRIKCPVSTSFPSNVDLVTCFHSFSSLFAPLIVRLRKSKELCRIKDCVPVEPARSAALSCRLYLGTPIFIAPVAKATSVALTILVSYASPGHRSSGTYLLRKSPMLIQNLDADTLNL